MANPTLTELRDLYFYLDNNFDDLKAACKTDDQKKALQQSYAAARDAFGQAVTLTFDEDDAEIIDLASQLKAVNGTLADMQASLGKIAKILQLAAKGVDIGMKLVGAAKG